MIDLNRLTVLETMQTADILVKAIISDVLHKVDVECAFGVLPGAAGIGTRQP